MIHYLISMRPRQWTKNLFIFTGIVFSGNLADPSMLLKASGAFLAFCLLSGGVYIINDILDIEKDRNHPRKKNRPLAAGLIGARPALVFAICAAAAALAISLALSPILGLIAAVYFSLMLAYSFYLKNIVLVDIFTIAAGFVLRVVAGIEVISVYLSPWAVACTFFLALFLALGKRRNEKIVLGEAANSHRAPLDGYSLPFLDQMISIVTASTVVAYFLYTFKYGQSLASMASIPFVLFGLFRYLYLVYSENSGGSPEEILLFDRPLQAAILLWVATSLAVLYI